MNIDTSQVINNNFINNNNNNTINLIFPGIAIPDLESGN